MFGGSLYVDDPAWVMRNANKLIPVADFDHFITIPGISLCENLFRFGTRERI